MDTPNIDRLVEHGVSFDQCHVTAPFCVPSRASLFAGCYPRTNGVLANGTEWSRTWVPDRAHAGYHCVTIGKMHTIPYDAKAGFHERYVVEGRWFTDEWDKAILNAGHATPGRLSYRAREDYRHALSAFESTLEDKLHSESFIGGFTGWWLDNRPRERPLFLSIGFPGPHLPCDPTPEYPGKYMARDVPLPHVTQDEIDRLPPPWKEKRRHDSEVDHDAVHWNLEPSEADLHKRLLLCQRRADRPRGRPHPRRTRAARAAGQQRGDLHLGPRRHPERPRAQPEMGALRAGHAGADGDQPARALPGAALRRAGAALRPRADPGETDDLWDVPEAVPVKAALLAELGRWHHERACRTRHVRARMMEA